MPVVRVSHFKDRKHTARDHERAQFEQSQTEAKDVVKEFRVETKKGRLHFRNVSVLATLSSSSKEGDKSGETPLLSWNDVTGLFDLTFEGVGGRMMFQASCADKISKMLVKLISESKDFTPRSQVQTPKTARSVSDAYSDLDNLGKATSAVSASYLSMLCNGLAIEAWEEVRDLISCLVEVKKVDVSADPERACGAIFQLCMQTESRADNFLGLVKARSHLIAEPGETLLYYQNRGGHIEDSSFVDKWESLDRALLRLGTLLTTSLNVVASKLCEMLSLFQVAHDPYYAPECVGGTEKTGGLSAYHDDEGVPTIKLHFDFFKLVMLYEKTLVYYRDILGNSGAAGPNPLDGMYSKEDFMSGTPSFNTGWTHQMSRRVLKTSLTILRRQNVPGYGDGGDDDDDADSLLSQMLDQVPGFNLLAAQLHSSMNIVSKAANVLGEAVQPIVQSMTSIADDIIGNRGPLKGGSAKENDIDTALSFSATARAALESAGLNFHEDGGIVMPVPNYGNAFCISSLPSATDLMIRYACTRGLALSDMLRIDPRELTAKGTRMARACLYEHEIMDLGFGHNGLSLSDFSFAQRRILSEMAYRRIIHTLAMTISRAAPGMSFEDLNSRVGDSSHALGAVMTETQESYNLRKFARRGSFVMGGWALERRCLCSLNAFPAMYHVSDVSDTPDKLPARLPKRRNPFFHERSSEPSLQKLGKLVPIFTSYRDEYLKLRHQREFLACLTPIHARFSGPRPHIEKLHSWYGRAVQLMHDCARYEHGYEKVLKRMNDNDEDSEEEEEEEADSDDDEAETVDHQVLHRSSDKKPTKTMILERLNATLHDATMYQGARAASINLVADPEMHDYRVMEQLTNSSSLVGESAIMLLHGLRLRWRSMSKAGVLGATAAVCSQASRMLMEYSALVNSKSHLYPESVTLKHLMVMHTDMMRVVDATWKLCGEIVNPNTMQIMSDLSSEMVGGDSPTKSPGHTVNHDKARAINELNKEMSGGMVQAYNAASLLIQYAQLSSQVGMLTENLRVIFKSEATRLVYDSVSKYSENLVLSTAQIMFERTFTQVPDGKGKVKISPWCHRIVASMVKPLINLCQKGVVDTRSRDMFLPYIHHCVCDALVTKARLDSLRTASLPSLVGKTLTVDVEYLRGLVEMGMKMNTSVLGETADASILVAPNPNKKLMTSPSMKPSGEEYPLETSFDTMYFAHERSLAVAAVLQSTPFTTLDHESFSIGDTVLLPDIDTWIHVRDFNHRAALEKQNREAGARLAMMDNRDTVAQGGCVMWRWFWRSKVAPMYVEEVKEKKVVVVDKKVPGKKDKKDAKKKDKGNEEEMEEQKEKEQKEKLWGGAEAPPRSEDPVVIMRRRVENLVPDSVNMNGWFG